MYRGTDLKDQVVRMRMSGQSVREIAKRLTISKSTVARWSLGVLSSSGSSRRLKVTRVGARLTKSSRTVGNGGLSDGPRTAFYNNSGSKLAQIKLDKAHKKIYTALLYATNGCLTTNYVSFTESDPVTVRAFLGLFRKAFMPVESGFRAMVYLNHNQPEGKIRQFWSKVSQIPVSRFTKSYIRSNTMGYNNGMGNFRVNYYDVRVVRELKGIYADFVKRVA